jgi:hypothetical protein
MGLKLSLYWWGALWIWSIDRLAPENLPAFSGVEDDA